MKLQLLELGTMVKDSITKTDGMLTHVVITGNGQKDYIYQPRGLSPTTGKPTDGFILTEERVVGGKIGTVDVPEIIGTKAEDIATGFKGIIEGVVYHLNGCIHVRIQPIGINKETGAVFGIEEFDIRRVKGEKIKPLAKKELKESRKITPSPMSYPRKTV